MSGGLQFDSGMSRKVESLYLTPDVVAQRCHTLKALELKEGERVLAHNVARGRLVARDEALSE